MEREHQWPLSAETSMVACDRFCSMDSSGWKPGPTGFACTKRSFMVMAPCGRSCRNQGCWKMPGMVSRWAGSATRSFWMRSRQFSEMLHAAAEAGAV